MRKNYLETETKRFFDKPKNVGCLILIILSIVIVIITDLCDGNSSSNLKFGDYGIVTTETFGRIDKSTIDELGKYTTANDKIGILQLMYEGRVDIIKAGTRVKIIDAS